MEPPTANSPSPRSAPAPTRCTQLPTACSATSRRPTSPSSPAKPSTSASSSGSPSAYGKQIWEIGYPDRAADEFFKGDGANYWLWGWNLRYALLFPNDLTYTVGKSDWHKDWFFEEVPHATNLSFVNPDAKDPANQRFGWVKAESLTQYPQTDQTGPWRVYGRGRETVWTIKFTMAKDEHRRGFAARGTRRREWTTRRFGSSVNGKRPGHIGDGSNPDNPRLINTDAIRYNTDKGLWQQRTLKFDAAMLKKGENTLPSRSQQENQQRRGLGLPPPRT